jgi:starch phosphorylase
VSSYNPFVALYWLITGKTVGGLPMEFMLSEALHIYSGGLGNVAGDQPKSTSRVAG